MACPPLPREYPGMTQAAPTLFKATMAALDIDLSSGGVPEWVHLLPTAKGPIQTKDDRGPYIVEDAAAIIAASFAEDTKLQIDENHAEDLKSNRGGSSPAHGWITELQARPDGVWGKVDWNASGRAMMENRSYRAMSPVVLHDASKKVVAILRASLVNRPNFRGLAALNQEKSMDSMAKMAAALGLGGDASEDAILSAIKALKDKEPEDEAALQSALSDIGVAFGLAADAKPEAVAAAAKLAKSGTADIVALQSELATVKTELTTLKTAGSRSASEAFIDKAIAERRAGVNAQNREELVSLHMSSKDVAEKLVNGMPMLTQTGTVQIPSNKSGEIDLTALNAEQQGVEIARLAKAYQAEQVKAGNTVEFAIAVQHVSEKLK